MCPSPHDYAVGKGESSPTEAKGHICYFPLPFVHSLRAPQSPPEEYLFHYRVTCNVTSVSRFKIRHIWKNFSEFGTVLLGTGGSGYHKTHFIENFSGRYFRPKKIGRAEIVPHTMVYLWKSLTFYCIIIKTFW